MNNLPCWSRRTGLLLTVICLTSLSLRTQAQWLTQTIALTNGWNAVYLHVDPSYDTLEHQVAWDTKNPIQEVWLWTPTLSSMQFIRSPQEPLPENSQWAAWSRSASLSSLLQRLVGNAAYLVRVETNAPPYTYTWNVKGQPVPPRYQWTTTGLNFLGFPTVPHLPPNFEAFLSPSPELYQHAEIYQYIGGELGSNNPVQVFALRNTPVQRGQAFWLRSGDLFNRYFGPFELRLSKSEGMDYGSQLGALSFRLRNLTTSNLTVTLELVASESPPSGQTAIVGVPPLLVRGSRDPTTLVYTYTNLTTTESYSWTLPGNTQPGCEIEAVLGLDRSVMSNPPGQLLAGILRFKDSLGHAQVDVPVSATADSSAGLWVGGAAILQVGEYLKSYGRDGTGKLIVSSNGSYVVTGINTNPGAVASPYPLRLIVHNPESSSNAKLLQRVYCGIDAATNSVIATGETALNRNYLAKARRISATHLPWTPTNTVWPFNGRLGQMTNLTATVTLDHTDHASNPFLHTYHPDHDNLDATFGAVLPQGSESYTVRRQISLGISPPADDFDSRTAAGQTFSGTYAETISLLGLARQGGTNDTRTFEVSGGFILNRITSNTNLVTAP